MKESVLIRSLLTNNGIADFVASNLQESLFDIGFSSILIQDLVGQLQNLNIAAFREKHAKELHAIYDLGFFQNIVPRYFDENVIPHLQPSERILDIGCGTGILAHRLSISKKFRKIQGIDINPYPEWQQFQDEITSFAIVPENNFEEFVLTYQPTTTVLTWSLHHMAFEEQERYITKLHKLLQHGTQIVVLEDAYSAIEQPLYGKDQYDAFMQWSMEQRKTIMSVYDWVANRVLAGRMNEPIPFTYRTLGEWIELFTTQNFSLQFKRFIGFPARRDIHTPQSVFGVVKN